MYESLITNDAIRAGKIGKKVVLFGAGEYGRIFIDRHKGNIAVSCFIDNGAADGSKCMYEWVCVKMFSVKKTPVSKI